jgi:hypothetical protein
MMNTADRSLAVVDYALRRRFGFVNLEPRFNDANFQTLLKKKGISDGMRQKIRTRLNALNERIREDKRNLGQGFEIGHSFFCPDQAIVDEEQWYRSVIEFEIKPLLREYWFDYPEKASQEAQRLMGENSD